MSKTVNGVMLVLGIALGAGMVLLNLRNQPADAVDAASVDEPQPLYWVAPMDPEYRRDKPGKSPMGMDLVPVYADSPAAGNTGPGTVEVSPEVVNNLGVRTAPVVRGALHSEINTVGYVRYDEDQLVHIHSRVEGWIDKLYVTASGDPVAKGQPLYALYAPALVNAQEELLLALERNNPRLIEAARERLRALQLPAASIRQLEKTRRVSQAVTFYAPISGVVDSLSIRQGYFVKPDKTLMAIGSLAQVWVDAEVFARQAPLLQAGSQVTMSMDYLPGKTWTGTVDYIYPTLDPLTRTNKVRLRFANADGELKPNMFVRVAIHGPAEEPVLLVPREALIRLGGTQRVVLALDGGRFKSVEVGVGRLDDKHVEIVQGLEEGDRVVTSAQFLLDSESSKTSDFARMDASPHAHHAVHGE